MKQCEEKCANMRVAVAEKIQVLFYVLSVIVDESEYAQQNGIVVIIYGQVRWLDITDCSDCELSAICTLPTCYALDLDTFNLILGEYSKV